MFYNEDKSLPVYQWTSSRQHYSIEELGKILLAGIVPESNICHVQPTSVCHNVSFVINLNSLDDPKDLRADENEVWNRQGAPIAYVNIYKPAKVICRTKMHSHTNCYKLSRTYYRHSTSPDFHRIITTVQSTEHLMVFKGVCC